MLSGPASGADAVAIAAQIGRYHMEALGELIGNLVPGNMGQRVAVQQQQRRPLAAMDEMNPRAAGIEVPKFSNPSNILPPSVDLLHAPGQDDGRAVRLSNTGAAAGSS